MHFVDEQDDSAFRRADLLQHRLKPLLELAAILGPGDQRAHVEGEKFLVLQALRHVAIDDSQRQAFGDRGFANAGLADEHRVVLRSPRQDLDRAANLVVATDDGIELALAGGFGQVPRIALQRVIGVLGRCRIGGTALAQLVNRSVEAVRRHARVGEDTKGLRTLLHRQGQQQPFDRDEIVAGLGGCFLRGLEDARGLGRKIELTGTAALDLGHPRQRHLDGLQRILRPAAGLLDQARGETLGIVEQDLEKMFGGKLLVALAQGKRLGRLDEAARPFGVFLEIHVSLFSGTSTRPKSTGSTSIRNCIRASAVATRFPNMVLLPRHKRGDGSGIRFHRFV